MIAKVGEILSPNKDAGHYLRGKDGKWASPHESHLVNSVFKKELEKAHQELIAKEQKA